MRSPCASAAPDGALDAIYIDPPFGTGSRAARPRPPLRRSRRRSRRVRRVARRRYLEHSRRVLAAHGSLFVHLDYRAVHYVKVALDRLFGRDALRQRDRVVLRGRRQEPARLRPQARHDPVVRARRRLGVLSRCGAGAAARRLSHAARRTASRRRPTRRPGASTATRSHAGKVPEDWWTDVETLNHSDRERTGWPSQKPERLVERDLSQPSPSRATASPTGLPARGRRRRSPSGWGAGSSSSIAKPRRSRSAKRRLATPRAARQAADSEIVRLSHLIAERLRVRVPRVKIP